MSFTFNWPRFSDQFHYDAIQMLNTALNKGNQPPIIADKIEVVELEMGTQPPELEIRDIGDLTVDHFRGIFRLTYSGDAHLVLRTKVQANPLNHKQPDIHLMTGSRGMLAANQPLVVPMLLRLSHFRLNSYVVLVVSKQKGITLVFKTDPLQNVDINSTFDSIAVIQKFIQREIEGQLRQMFREDLPGIIHRLSQQWVKAKVEAPYLNKRFPPTPTKTQLFKTSSFPDLTAEPASPRAGPSRHFGRTQSLGAPSVKRSSVSSASGSSTTGFNHRVSSSKPANIPSSQTSSPDPSSHGEYEIFDPTYGLRPEGLPTKSGFKGFSSLFTPNKGLADLTEERSGDEGEEEYEDDGESTSFDVVEWEDTVSSISPPFQAERASTPEYETIPAVGGGTITRPRVLHSQSTIQPPPGITPRLSPSLYTLYSRPHGNIRSDVVTPGTLTRQSSGSSYFPETHLFHDPSRTANPHVLSRPRTPNSADSSASSSMNDYYTPQLNLRQRKYSDPTSSMHHLHPSTHSQNLDSIYIRRPNSERRFSISSSASHQSATTTTTTPYHHATEPNSKIIRPSLNNDSIHHLSTLSHSNHTLSPYTRSLSHFTVRSVPPRSWSAGGLGIGGGMSGLASNAGTVNERQPIKAKRKRIFRIGGKKPTDTSTPSTTGATSTLPDSAVYNSRSGFEMNGERWTGDRSVPDPGSGSGPGTHDQIHHLRQPHPISSEFDAEDMNRYFRSNDDLSIPPPSSSFRGTIPSSPPRHPVMQAIQQHLQDVRYAQGVSMGSPGTTVSAYGNMDSRDGGGDSGAARRRQALSNSSRL